MMLQRFAEYLSEDFIPEGYEMRPVPAKTAADLLSKYHYLGRMPRATVIVCAVFEDEKPEPVAAVFFGHPATHWQVPVLELTRLVRSDDCKMSLTQLVAFACKQIKQDKSLPQLLISYADPAAGHHGGIYQASSWNFHAKRGSYVDGAMVNGVFVPWRTLRHKYGSSSANVVKQKNPEMDIVKHVAEGKYLYWRALDGRAEKDAKTVGLEKNPYPKPGQS
jgi:hypothetical protein